MDRRRALIVLVILLVTVAGALGYAQFLAPLPEPSPTPAVGPAQLVVSAEGLVVPHREARLSFKVGGRVLEILVEEGDVVEEGEVLIRLAAQDLEARVAQSRAALAAAQAQLELARAGPRPEEVAAARANLRSAQAQLSKLETGASSDERAVAEAQLELARVELALAQAAYDAVQYLPGVGATPQAVALQEAYLAYGSAQAAYNLAVGGAREEDLEMARAAVDATRAQLDLLLAGARPEELAALEAQVAGAEAVLAEAEAALAEASLAAPFEGTVALVEGQLGELVLPGQPALVLGDLSNLWVKTTDLDETSLPLVAVGGSVRISVDALPSIAFTGRVLRIAPLAMESRGDRVFEVIIDLDQGTEAGLRWGMTAFVDIQVP